MKQTPSWTFGLLLTLAIIVNWSGEFLIHQHFGSTQTEKEEVISSTEFEEEHSTPQEFSQTEKPETQPKVYSEHNSPFAMVSAEEEAKKIQAKPVSEEIKLKIGPPEKLKSDIEATPINENKAKWLRELIKKELPESSAEEQDAWFAELKDMPLKMAQDLLIMRKKMGIPSFNSDLFPSTTETHENQPEASATQEWPLLSPQSENLKQQATILNSTKALNIAIKTILNNIANANTTAFKRSEPVLVPQPYALKEFPKQDLNAGSYTPITSSIGSGVHFNGVQTDFAQGEFRNTNSILDISISGNGFFQVTDGNMIFYTRDGTFTTNSDGNIVLARAHKVYLLDPAINIPQNITSLSISSEGVVSITQEGSPGTTTEIGQIQLAKFINPQGLIALAENIYQETVSSGSPIQGNAGSEGLGTLQQSTLEVSNVDLEEEKLKLKLYQQTLNALREASRILSNEIPGTEIIPPQSAILPFEEIRR